MLQLCRRLPITLLERPTLQIHTDTCFLSLGGPKPWVIWMIWCRSHFQNLTWGQRAEESARLLGRTSSKRSTLWWRAPLARCKHCPSLKSYERESAGWPTERGFKKNRGVRIFQNILSLYRVYIYIYIMGVCIMGGYIYIFRISCEGKISQLLEARIPWTPTSTHLDPFMLQASKWDSLSSLNLSFVTHLSGAMPTSVNFIKGEYSNHRHW